ncbi:MAG TPA: hypothetical protein VFI06_07870, partial [Chitinophagaceae bacterium]|nr:hypothetical protein [Chitinophagaceae bacterium]
FAYDSYDNADVGDGEAAVRSLVASITNLRELLESFESKASRKGFGDKIELSKSMVRLNCPGTDTKPFSKTGGGSRVKKVQISDQWADMVSSAKTAKYGQLYDYTIRDNSNMVLSSSGVASYEPQIGNEENPFHEPVDFVEKVHWSADKYHFIEKPFCETYFPAASVGYSKVTVTSFGDDYANGAPLTNPTGYIVNEFYTAKDFPTEVDYLPLQPTQYETKLSMQLFTSHYAKRVWAAQGFKVELNDMHGKAKSVKVFNKAGDMISSTEYAYNVEDNEKETKKLNNVVDVLTDVGRIETTPISTDIDFVTDQRQSKSETHGKRTAPYVGIFSVQFPPFILGFFWLNKSSSESIKNFYSISTVKVIHRFGIVKKVTTKQNGSTIEAENLLWDAETGQVLLTKTQNEFDKYTYAFSYPAYRAYEGMNGAYKNLGATFTNFQTNTSGLITSLTTQMQNDYLFPGDELVSSNQEIKGWIIRSQDGTLRLVDKNGDFIISSGEWTIIRSGRRNIQGAGVGTVVCMKDPRVISSGARVIDLGVDKKILDSKSAVFKEEWGIEVNSPYYTSDCASGSPTGRFASKSDSSYVFDSSSTGIELRQTPSLSLPGNCTCTCLKGFFDYLIHSNKLFIQQSQNITVGQLVAEANAAGYPVGHCQILDMNVDQLFYALTSNTTATIYTAKIGDCIVSIRSNDSNPVSFYGLTSQSCVSGQSVSYSGAGSQTVTQTLYTTCANAFTLYPDGSVPNSTRLVASYNTDANGIQSKLTSTSFKIDGISAIPSNAQIQSANFYMYAVPEGYNPPTYPNAHTTTIEAPLLLPSIWSIDYIFGGSWNCISRPNGWRGPVSNLPTIQNHFSDVIVDMRALVSNLVYYHGNPGFTFLTWPANNNAHTPNLLGYNTFASENYSDPSKRPRLEVTYLIPGSSSNIATLTVDDCTTCPNPVGRKINPYYTGVLGNWRPYISYVYTVSREEKQGNPNQTGGTDIRNSGSYSTYAPFWNWQDGLLQRTFSGDEVTTVTDPLSRWVWNSKSIYYDQKGNEIESKDPLGRFGSALFGYQQSMATAVAANARHNEIAFDGFEDYDFNVVDNSPIQTPSCLTINPFVPTPSCQLPKHFDFGFANQSGVWTSPVGSIISTRSHTGKYSYHINGTVNITKAPGSDAEPQASILGWDATGRYKLLSNELASGFAPVPNREYLLSFWVYDNDAAHHNKIQNLSVTINGVSQNVSTLVVPVVEDWKRLELKFTMPASGNFSLQINGSNIEIDDFRILPNAGQMNSYVYDDVTMRLMAQLDENNFATLYEYDEEGTPVRVKKETEKGVMTLKESRQFFRKRL